MAGKKKQRLTVDVTTGIGVISFPRLSKETANKKDDGTLSYDIQILLPKSDRVNIRKVLKAIQQVGEHEWGDKWKQVRSPLRDGDAEKDELTEDGSTKGEKYPERLGCYFINARSSRPVTVVDRHLAALDPDEVYGGCKGKISVTFYPYSVSGNHGIGAGLNGVQKIAEGEPFGGGAPAVESMFEEIDDDEDGLDGVDEVEDDEVEEVEEKPTRRRTKKAAAKKAAPRRKPEPEPEDDEDEYDDEDYDDLDDSDA